MHKSNKSGVFGQFVTAILLTAAVTAAAWAQTAEPVMVYMKAGVDVKQYNQLLIAPLNLSDARVVPPPWVENPDPRKWQLTKENRDFLTTAFASAVRQGIEAKGEFKVVDSREPGTLQIEVRIISLTPWASRGEKVETLGTGTLTFEAQVRDARTSELLAVLQGAQQVGQDYQENTEFDIKHGLTEHFTRWGRHISERLTAARAQ